MSGGLSVSPPPPRCVVTVEPPAGTEPFLSVVVPAYNEQARIFASLAELTRYLHEQPYSWEVIVVDDGSSDATGSVVHEWAARNRGFRLERISHRGKGAAGKHGMLSARGAYRFMCDADLAMPLEYLGEFVGMLEKGWDIAIASRESAGARRLGESPLRYFLGRLFNGLVRVLVMREFNDTHADSSVSGRTSPTRSSRCSERTAGVSMWRSCTWPARGTCESPRYQ